MTSEPCYKILAIDGGGIRGIIPAAVLIDIERQVRAARGDATIKIGECFDMIAGTSTGGILGLLLNIPDPANPGRALYSATDALNLYMQHGGKIFDRSVWQIIHSADGVADEKYSASNIEEIMKEYFKDVQLSGLLTECLITSYDTRKYRPYFFTKHDALSTPSANFYVRDAARATSAAPTYFQAAQPRNLAGIDNPAPMIDGGVFANDPAMCALVEAMQLQEPKLPIEQFAILSLGTGRQPKSYSYDEIKNWGLAGWARPIIDILMEGNSQTVDYELQTMFSSVGRAESYLRIDGKFGDVDAGLDIAGLDSRMDNASVENMKKLQTFGQQLAANATSQIKEFVATHLSNVPRT